MVFILDNLSPNWMLKRFEIENFRNFEKRAIVDFSKTREYSFNAHLIRNGLTNKMVIVGRNGCGKTNLGIAIMDLSRVLNFNEQCETVFSTDFLNGNNDCGYATFVYVFQFGDAEISYEYRKSDPNTIVYEKFEVNGTTMLLREGPAISIARLFGCDLCKSDLHIKNGTASVIGSISAETNLPPESPIKMMTDFVRGMQHIGTSLDHANRTRTIAEYIAENNLVADFASFLHETAGLDLNLEIVASDTRKTLMLKTKNGDIPFDRVVSGGIVSLMPLYHWTKISKGTSFLFIDCFDANYHYRLSDNLFKLMTENTAYQTVFTTHNLSLISNYAMRPDCCWHMIDGALYPLPEMTDRELREGHSMERLMRGGEFDDPPSRAQY